MAHPKVDVWYGWDLHLVSRNKLVEWIEEVVRVESPVHILDVASRVANAAGVGRVGSRIRQAVEQAAGLAELLGVVRLRGDFLWHKDMEVPPVRNRSQLPAASRQIERIAPEELSEAIVLAVKGNVAINREEAIVEACRLLGFGRTSEAIRQHVDRTVDSLVTSRRLTVRNGFLMVE